MNEIIIYGRSMVLIWYFLEETLNAGAFKEELQ